MLPATGRDLITAKLRQPQAGKKMRIAPPEIFLEKAEARGFNGGDDR
jgi:hypothetical protein